MSPLASWALILALLLVAYVVIAERRGWLNDPTPQRHDTDDEDDWMPADYYEAAQVGWPMTHPAPQQHDDDTDETKDWTP